MVFRWRIIFLCFSVALGLFIPARITTAILATVIFRMVMLVVVSWSCVVCTATAVIAVITVLSVIVVMIEAKRFDAISISIFFIPNSLSFDWYTYGIELVWAVRTYQHSILLLQCCT